MARQAETTRVNCEAGWAGALVKIAQFGAMPRPSETSGVGPW